MGYNGLGGLVFSLSIDRAEFCLLWLLAPSPPSLASPPQRNRHSPVVVGCSASDLFANRLNRGRPGIAGPASIAGGQTPGERGYNSITFFCKCKYSLDTLASPYAIIKPFRTVSTCLLLPVARQDTTYGSVVIFVVSFIKSLPSMALARRDVPQTQAKPVDIVLSCCPQYDNGL